MSFRGDIDDRLITAVVDLFQLKVIFTYSMFNLLVIYHVVQMIFLRVFIFYVLQRPVCISCKNIAASKALSWPSGAMWIAVNYDSNLTSG